MTYNVNESMSTKTRSGGAVDMGDLATNIADKALERADRLRVGVENAAETVTARGREAAGQAQEVAGNFKQAVDKSVRNQPTATLIMAAAMGFLIGALWKS